MRLIVSDLDGTLLIKGEENLHQKTASAIESLLDNGDIFCVASGRSYSELKRIFKKFQDRIYFIASDGAIIIHKEKTLYEANINKEKDRFFGCEKSVVAHGKYISYVKSSQERFVRQIKKQYYGHTVQVYCEDEISEPIYKIAVYDEKGENPDLEPVYRKNSVSEYIKNGIDKGTAISELSKMLNITGSDVIAVGDGENDAAMLKFAGKSYVIATAPPRVKEFGKYIVNDFSDAAEMLLEE